MSLPNNILQLKDKMHSANRARNHEQMIHYTYEYYNALVNAYNSTHDEEVDYELIFANMQMVRIQLSKKNFSELLYHAKKAGERAKKYWNYDSLHPSIDADYVLSLHYQSFACTKLGRISEAENYHAEMYKLSQELKRNYPYDEYVQSTLKEINWELPGRNSSSSTNASASEDSKDAWIGVAIIGYAILTFIFLHGFWNIIGVWGLGFILLMILIGVSENTRLKESKTANLVFGGIFAVFTLIVILYNIN